MAVTQKFGALVKRETPIRDAIAMMGRSTTNKNIAGFAVVVDPSHKVLGALADGDIRRGLAKGLTIDEPVEKIANFKPLTLKQSLAPSLMRRTLLDETHRRGTHFTKYDKLILVDDEGAFADVIALADILEPQIDEKKIAVYGLGFVGLTLACTMANAGLSVIGVDTDTHKLQQLEQGIAPFYEKGLDSMLSSLATNNPLRYLADAAQAEADVHIVSVGSPLDKNGKPDLSALMAVTQSIARTLKSGDLVMYRSTVPVGTTRNVLLPLLEQSGLRCGDDFFLAFTPERTVEGNALEELRLLPQIVGGFNRKCTNLAARLFRHITNVVVEVQSLEEAELVKLMNNTFRDLSFSFANEVAYICDAYNINAFRVIRAANEGYPRDRIPLPGPGVGGPCLTKDPILYSQPKNGYTPALGRASRSINERGHVYVMGKIIQFAQHIGKPVEQLRVLIVGLAFKGMPETSDIRDSIAARLVEAFPNKKTLAVKDFVVAEAVIQKLGCTALNRELQDALANYDAVLFMNNHYRNNKFNVIDALKNLDHPLFFFDGWSMFDWREIERIPNVCYATMGYMTPGFSG